jgi:hypothetical protein
MSIDHEGLQASHNQRLALTVTTQNQTGGGQVLPYLVALAGGGRRCPASRVERGGEFNHLVAIVYNGRQSKHYRLHGDPGKSTPRPPPATQPVVTDFKPCLIVYRACFFQAFSFHQNFFITGAKSRSTLESKFQTFVDFIGRPPLSEALNSRLLVSSPSFNPTAAVLCSAFRPDFLDRSQPHQSGAFDSSITVLDLTVHRLNLSLAVMVTRHGCQPNRVVGSVDSNYEPLRAVFMDQALVPLPRPRPLGLFPAGLALTSLALVVLLYSWSFGVALRFASASTCLTDWRSWLSSRAELVEALLLTIDQFRVIGVLVARLTARWFVESFQPLALLPLIFWLSAASPLLLGRSAAFSLARALWGAVIRGW